MGAVVVQADPSRRRRAFGSKCHEGGVNVQLLDFCFKLFNNFHFELLYVCFKFFCNSVSFALAFPAKELFSSSIETDSAQGWVGVGDMFC
jgi:hypothetical protein